MAPNTYVRRLYLAQEHPWRPLLRRLALVIIILCFAWFILWIERDGLRDSKGTPVGAMDVLYFAIVTVTTLGYGDIVPVSPGARAMVAFGITPLRLLIWLLLLNTAYEFTLRRSIEKIEMKNLKRTLTGHIVICGFGVKGRSAVKEMVERGIELGSILVIDTDPVAIGDANRMGLNAICGNAATEDVLRDAAVDRASEVIVLADNDESCVLICLTVRELAPTVKLRAAARMEENVKLIERCGADTVIAPSVSAGRLLAAAALAPHSTEVMEELLSHGKGADIIDFTIHAEDAGKLLKDLRMAKGWQVLLVRTADGNTLTLDAGDSRLLQAGDSIVAYIPAG